MVPLRAPKGSGLLSHVRDARRLRAPRERVALDAPRQVVPDGRVRPHDEIRDVGDEQVGVVVGRRDERHVRRLVEPVARRAHRAHPSGARRADADDVAADGLVEDVVLVDVRIEEDRARDERDRTDRPRVGGASLVRVDAREGRRDVLRDVARVDRADALAVARREGQVLEGPEDDRSLRQHGSRRRCRRAGWARRTRRSPCWSMQLVSRGGGSV